MGEVLSITNGRVTKNIAPVSDLWFRVVANWPASVNNIGELLSIESTTPPTQMVCLWWTIFSGTGFFEDCDSGRNDNSITINPVGYQTVDFHWVKFTLTELIVNGSTLWTDLDFYSVDCDQISVANSDFPDTAYWRSVSIGTAQGLGDLFFDDFSSGDLSNWDLVTGDAAVVPDPYEARPPVPAPNAQVRDFDPPLWRIIVTSLTGETISLLDTRATGRQFLYTLNAPAQATGQVAADDQEIDLPWPNADDPALVSQFSRLMYGFRREMGTFPDPAWICRFGGIVMPMQDEGADAPTSTYTAYDPWQLMFSRPARNPNTGALIGDSGYTFPVGTRASAIAYAMFSNSEVLDGETHMLLDTFQATAPLTAPFTIEQGQTVGEVWQALTDTGTIDIVLDPLYDPIGNPGKVVTLNIYRKAGSIRYNSVLAWDLGPRSASGVNRMIDRLANKVLFYGGSGAPASHVQTDAASVSDFGKYWAMQVMDGSIHPALVDLYALAQLEIRKRGMRNITFDPMPERSQMLALREYKLGDYVPLWATRNFREPLGVDYDSFDPDFPGASGYQRCYSIPITVDDNGVERVTGITTSQDNLSS